MVVLFGVWLGNLSDKIYFSLASHLLEMVYFRASGYYGCPQLQTHSTERDPDINNYQFSDNRVHFIYYIILFIFISIYE